MGKQEHNEDDDLRHFTPDGLQFQLKLCALPLGVMVAALAGMREKLIEDMSLCPNCFDQMYDILRENLGRMVALKMAVQTEDRNMLSDRRN
jgi:hypothetical protein